MADVSITASAGVISTRGLMGILTHTPAAGVNAALNTTFDCSQYDSSGTYLLGIPSITISGTGTWFNVGIIADAGVITLTSPTDVSMGELWVASTGVITLSGKTSDVVTEAIRKNWVKWSNIGSLDFTVWKDNIAGERPLDFNGWVYALKKLGNKVIAYGENGVSALVPAGNAYGLQSIYRLGLKGKHAVCGTDSEHYFVDVEGHLFRLSDNLEKLDYSEYLSGLSSTLVMSFDCETGLIYLCDGAQGYIYNPSEKSLGEGPSNITGIGSQGATLYVAAPATISTPAFEICSDIYDFGSRQAKTVRSVQIGTDMTQTLSVALDYRRDKSAAFAATPWRTADNTGEAFFTCYGQEFRAKVKSSAYEYFEIDYITITGELHDY